MNWKELYALVNENIKNAVSGLYKPAGDVAFAELPELSQSVLGYTYTVTDAFTTDSRFTDYDTETQTGHSFPADTEVAVIVTGTTENPVYMFNVMGGIMDGYATKGDLDNYVEKENGKSLSTNDYTDADKALVQDSPITVTSTTSPITTAAGKPNAITVYGNSEVVEGEIKSVGEGWATVDLGTLTWVLNSAQNVFVASVAPGSSEILNAVCGAYRNVNKSWDRLDNGEFNYGQPIQAAGTRAIAVKDTAYSDPDVFKSAMTGVILAYPLADPTQGNAIAVKTDDGTGIDGTMAVLETGTPLRGITGGVRDVAEWDGASGEVTKNCAKLRLADLTWSSSQTSLFLSSPVSDMVLSAQGAKGICNKYQIVNTVPIPDKSAIIGSTSIASSTARVAIKDTDYTTVSDFVASLGDAELIYELATPTTTPFTATENASFAGLETYTPQTHFTNNAGADMTIEAYAGTANGKAVNELKDKVQKQIDDIKLEREHFCYSYKIDMNNSDPFTNCKPHFDQRYGCDNFNFTSAHMDYANDKFDYGSWEPFIRRIARPCMLKYDGTVDYYLDPDDYSKKITGEASDVADLNYNGNVMVELEKLYFKRYTHNGIQYCFISDRKLDNSFKCWAHHDKYGKELDYIYRAAYDGCYDGTRLRSISGIDYHNLNTLTVNKIMSNTTRAEEIAFAQANNVASEQGEGWYILHKSEWDYINDILFLIGMSTDVQTTFGRGRDSGYVSTSDTGIISTGTMDDKGLFWGKNDGSAGVKVLGIENHWANLFKSCAGWINDKGTQKVKYTYGTEDGSTGEGFNIDASGYISITGATPTKGDSSTSGYGYITAWQYGEYGTIPYEAISGASNKYLCDFLYFNNTATCFALVGGASDGGLPCGAFYSYLARGAGDRYWHLGAALSYKGKAA